MLTILRSLQKHLAGKAMRRYIRLALHEEMRSANVSASVQWLHLSGYAWGGLASMFEPDSKATPASSQQPLNLCIGTSQWRPTASFLRTTSARASSG